MLSSCIRLKHHVSSPQNNSSVLFTFFLRTSSIVSTQLHNYAIVHTDPTAGPIDMSLPANETVFVVVLVVLYTHVARSCDRRRLRPAATRRPSQDSELSRLLDDGRRDAGRSSSPGRGGGNGRGGSVEPREIRRPHQWRWVYVLFFSFFTLLFRFIS